MKFFEKIFFAVILLCPLYTNAQKIKQDTTDEWSTKPDIHWGAFIDAYYAYDFSKPEESNRQSFLFHHNRHNEININNAILQGSVEHSKYHAKLAFHEGTYVKDNYALDALRNIYEASIGISLNKKNSLWFDAGIMPSNIGYASAISMDNYTLSRSLSAECTPYYLSCAKLGYQIDEKWKVTGMVSNGWQRIKRVPDNSHLSLGTQVDYQSEKVTIVWGTFIGSDDPDSTRRMRYYNSAFLQAKLSDKVSAIVGLDYGIQQKTKNSDEYINAFSPALIVQYKFKSKWQMAIRAEHFNDKDGLTLAVNTHNGFQTSAFSYNIDYLPNKKICWRIEGRYFNSKDKIFTYNNETTNQNFVLSTSLAIKIGDFQ